MVNRDMIKKVKQSTVAVGLVQRNSAIPLTIYGSGFIIDDNGTIATAHHVLEYCKKTKKLLKDTKNFDADYAIFRPMLTTSEVAIDTAVISDLKKMTLTKKSKNFSLNILDIGFGKMLSPIPDCIPLELGSIKPDMTDEVAMCGFPAGDYSLDLQGKRMGQRFSPTFQTGKVSGLLPFDDAPDPYGIQTDIIGVGGSSGSPILDSNDGTVIGIAQQVLPASVEVSVKDELNKKQMKGVGIATIGQVYGISHNVLYDIIKNIKKFYRGEKIEELVIHATGFEFTQHFTTKMTVDKSKLE